MSSSVSVPNTGTIVARDADEANRIVIDLAFTTDIDLSTVRMLTDFARRAAHEGVAVKVASAHYRVRRLLLRQRCAPLLGDLSRAYSVAELVEAPQDASPPSPAPPAIPA